MLVTQITTRQVKEELKSGPENSTAKEHKPYCPPNHRPQSKCEAPKPGTDSAEGSSKGSLPPGWAAQQTPDGGVYYTYNDPNTQIKTKIRPGPKSSVRVSEAENTKPKGQEDSLSNVESKSTEDKTKDVPGNEGTGESQSDAEDHDEELIFPARLSRPY
jgi:hypothetical protein